MERVAAIQASLAAAVELESDRAAQNDAGENTETDDPVIQIERLITLGIAQSDVIRLKNAGFVSVAGVKMTSKKVRDRFLISSLSLPVTLLTPTVDSHRHQRSHRTQDQSYLGCMQST